MGRGPYLAGAFVRRIRNKLRSGAEFWHLVTHGCQRPTVPILEVPPPPSPNLCLKGSRLPPLKKTTLSSAGFNIDRDLTLVKKRGEGFFLSQSNWQHKVCLGISV